MSTSTKKTTSTDSQAHPANAGAWAITKAVREADRKMRQRYPVLRHQTALGMACVAMAYAIAATSAWLFLTGRLPFFLCIPINAVCFAVLREIEHDLIHDLYFKGRRAVQNFVLFAIWPALGNVPSPLYRRKIHLLHHKSSGTVDDIEERLVGNGTRYGFLRWFAMLDPGLSVLFRSRELKQIPGYRRGELLLNLVPVNALYYVMWVSFLVWHAAQALGLAPELPGWLDAVAVVWILPNVLRQACLAVLTSTMHYYGDIDTVVQQTQVLSKWYWQPLQLFTCNFGKSHAIHHFVVNQPFYLRELVRRDAHAAMRANGVRFDDVGTFARANRWGADGVPGVAR